MTADAQRPAGSPGLVSSSEPPVRAGFAVAEDGTRLYWRAVGSGPALLCCNGVGVSMFFWKYLVAHYCRTHTVILWDYRAHGRSDRPAELDGVDLSIERHARDLLVVLDHLGVPEAMLLGHSMGVQVILETYRIAPDRVRGLVPMLGTAGRTLETFYDFRYSPQIFALLARGLERIGDRAHYVIRPTLESPLAWWFARKAFLVDPYYTRQEDMLPYMRHLASLDMRVFVRSVLAAQAHDAWDTLPGIWVPTLVVAAERDAFTPMWLSRKIASTIPGAELLVLAEATHTAIIEQPDTINHRLDRFLTERKVFRAPPENRSPLQGRR